MVLCPRVRVSKMRLHNLHSLRNKKVTVLPAGSTLLILILLTALSPEQPRNTSEIKRLSGLLSSAAQGSGFIIWVPFSRWTS